MARKSRTEDIAPLHPQMNAAYAVELARRRPRLHP